MVLYSVYVQTANLEAFDTERSISLVPSDGEFALATYRTSHAITPPYRLQVNVESDAASEYKVRAGGASSKELGGGEGFWLASVEAEVVQGRCS